MNKKERTLAIFTLVEHKKIDGRLYGYAPYIREMNIWTSHFRKVLVVGLFNDSKTLEKIDLSYSHQNLELIKIPKFNVKSFSNILKLLITLPGIMIKMAGVMRYSDYLHFRCPSNVSAIAAIVQVFFPSKLKSTRYAGNWDPNSNQPIGYKFQKWLLGNRILTRNMKILVYGEWENQPKSVKPFMAATFSEAEKTPYINRAYSEKLKFVFTAAMVVGKRPILTVKIIELLLQKGISAELHMFGDGILTEEVKAYVATNNLEDSVFVHGNQEKQVIKECLLDAHFTILPSKSEGWPKAIAEGMFFGAIPISTKISCLPWMLDNGNRGILVEPQLEAAVAKIEQELSKGEEYLSSMSRKAQDWSQQYTLDRLELEIERIVKQ